MSIELIKESDTYEAEYQDGTETPPIFVLRKLTGKKWDSIQDQIMFTEGTGRGGGKFRYLSGLSTTLKIDYCLTDWRNVNTDGGAVPCTPENKGKLPQEIRSWIERRINKDNNLDGISEDERKNF